MKVKLFSDYSDHDLEIKVNRFIESEVKELIDIKFNVCLVKKLDHQATLYSALIIYK